jgi:phosphatidylserine/phosphatidylglycerophosphate/cardiolipin synthase-like enzyme
MKFKHLKTLLLLVLFLPAVTPQICLGESFSPKSSYSVYFAPRDNCAYEIIRAIAQANKQILVQVYIFNDMSIAKALVQAKRSGVDVKIILDKTRTKKQHEVISFLRENKIKVIEADYLPAILHAHKAMGVSP